MNYIRPFLAVIVSAALLQAASAQSFSGGPINPGDGNTLGGTSVATVPIGQITNLADFRIEIDVTWTTAHTWVGDVQLRITGPAAGGSVTVPLMIQPGKIAAPQIGDGHNTNLLGTYTFRDTNVLNDQRIVDASQAGAGNTAFVIPPGAYRATNNLFNGDPGPTFSGEQLQTLDGQFGTTGEGDWTLFFSDNAGFDYAPVDNWVIRFVPVPEPTSMLALGAGVVGLGGLIRRRMRRPTAVV